MRRARRWLAESREEAAKHGQALPERTVRWLEHIAGCRDCQLREHMDPDLCPLADAIEGEEGRT
jgi:hypothetical protein